jgi:hypothetical protein
VGSLAVVEGKVLGQPQPQLQQTGITLDVDVLIRRL